MLWELIDFTEKFYIFIKWGVRLQPCPELKI